MRVIIRHGAVSGNVASFPFAAHFLTLSLSLSLSLPLSPYHPFCFIIISPFGAICTWLIDWYYDSCSSVHVMWYYNASNVMLHCHFYASAITWNDIHIYECLSDSMAFLRIDGGSAVFLFWEAINYDGAIFLRTARLFSGFDSSVSSILFFYTIIVIIIWVFIYVSVGVKNVCFLFGICSLKDADWWWHHCSDLLKEGRLSTVICCRPVIKDMLYQPVMCDVAVWVPFRSLVLRPCDVNSCFYLFVICIWMQARYCA